ncbi:hypothetical protein AX17_000976 [Amanita inopinata Kibby_2008]|nr:hypothetical protein AX17_000976 [Amanita inopinata Kibby_2008]
MLENRLDALAFKPSKSQRKLTNRYAYHHRVFDPTTYFHILERWNRFVLQGKDGERMDIDSGPNSKKTAKTKSPTFSLTSSIHASEKGFHAETHPAHEFEVILEPSSYSSEKFALYQRYQEDIHGDTHNTPSSFKRFLVESPLLTEPIPYSSPPPSHLPVHYGSYHQLYKLDQRLIAMAVLDILPFCVSSVYFVYDKQWQDFSFGKLSAMREVALAREMETAGAPKMGFVYMGYYIHSCQKMRYKGEYSPSYLADPVSYQWYPLKECIPLLERYRYACFSDPDRSIHGTAEPDDDSYPPVGEDALQAVRVKLEHRGRTIFIPVTMTNIMKYKNLQREVEDCVRELGVDVSKQIIMSFEA